MAFAVRPWSYFKLAHLHISSEMERTEGKGKKAKEEGKKENGKKKKSGLDVNHIF